MAATFYKSIFLNMNNLPPLSGPTGNQGENEDEDESGSEDIVGYKVSDAAIGEGVEGLF